MTLEEYIKQMQQDEQWSPGWLAIDSCFEKPYPNQEPKRYGTNLAKRAIFGDPDFLDDFSICQSTNGYKHLVTYGMSSLYADENITVDGETIEKI